MVSSGKVSCIVYLLLRVMCVLMHVHVLVDVNVSVIMCILVWIRVHVCVAPLVVVGAWQMAETLLRLFEYYTSQKQILLFHCVCLLLQAALVPMYIRVGVHTCTYVLHYG